MLLGNKGPAGRTVMVSVMSQEDDDGSPFTI